MLRQLADDVKDRFVRLRMRGVARTNDNASSRKRIATKNKNAQLPPTHQLPPPGRRRATLDSATAESRTETPDLIRPHVDNRKASLPPLPPSKTEAEMTSSRRRAIIDHDSRRQQPPSYIGMHVYEEIPTLNNRKQSENSQPPERGRVYYISPIDGALCRIYPTDDAVNHQQLACPHVRRRPSTGSRQTQPLDVTMLALDGSGGDSTPTYVMRGRELRMCAACYAALRDRLETTARESRSHPTAAPPSFYDACDLDLIHIPCSQYSFMSDSDEGYDASSSTVDFRSVCGRQQDATRTTITNCNGDDDGSNVDGCSTSSTSTQPATTSMTSSTHRRTPTVIAACGVVVHDRAVGDVTGDVIGVSTSPSGTNRVRTGRSSASGLLQRPRLGDCGGRSAFTKVVGRRCSLPVLSGTSLDESCTSLAGGHERLQSTVSSSSTFVANDDDDSGINLENLTMDSRMKLPPRSLKQRRSQQPHRTSFSSDQRRRPLRDIDDVIAHQLSATADESSYLCLCDCNKDGDCDNGDCISASGSKQVLVAAGNADSEASKTPAGDAVHIPEFQKGDTNGGGGVAVTTSGDDKQAHRRSHNEVTIRRPSGSVRSSQTMDHRRNWKNHQYDDDDDDDDDDARFFRMRRATKVRSVCYNGRLASMIDLTGCDAGLTDRLSCRATSGPRAFQLQQQGRPSSRLPCPAAGDSDEMMEKKPPQQQSSRIGRSTAERHQLVTCGRQPSVAASAFRRSMGDLKLTSVR